jgi:plastocyanin
MAPKKKHKIEFTSLDPSVTMEDLEKLDNGQEIGHPLIKSIFNALDRNEKINRLSFEEDPSLTNRFGGLFFEKVGLLPDKVLKRIAYTDGLIAAILQTRASQCSPFGKPLEDKYDIGFRISPTPHGDFEELSPEKKKEIVQRAKNLTKRLATCGNTSQWESNKQMSLSTFLSISARNACLFGRFSTEIIWVTNPKTNERIMHSFRPNDTGTIYRAIPKSPSIDSVRREALRRLAELKNEKLKPEKFQNDEYAWVQVINGVPAQAFGPDECIVYNCYPVTDVELNGYPITPIDTVIADVTMHINITNHNKLYFQTGRAARGMLVIESDDIDPSSLGDLKQQFNAAINSVANAWKMPVLKVAVGDKITWTPIDNSSRDMEFQYLADSNTRSILSAFQMSPDEIPGYAHLSKGTNNQALSESNNEYKLEAARDVGIRPLLSHLQDFLNLRILPLMDSEVAKYCSIKLLGIDSDTQEKERTAIAEAMEQSMTYDEIMRKLEKNPVGKENGGNFPLNPGFQAVLDRYFSVGQIEEFFFGLEGASKDPNKQYRRDPFYFQALQIQMQQQQAQEQQKMAQQQLAVQQQQQQQAQQGGGKKDEGAEQLTSGVDQLLGHMQKNERIPETKKKLLEHHDKIVKEIMDSWNKHSEITLAEIEELVAKNKR